MLLSWTLTCLIALALSTVLLVTLGHRIHRASVVAGLVTALVVIVAAGELAARIWQLPSGAVLQAEVLLVVTGWSVVFLRRAWNPVGQVFMGSFVGAALSYLLFAAYLTVSSHLSIAGVAASTLLFFLELSGLTIGGYFTFESLDSTVRTRHDRPAYPFDPTYQPRVSLQVAAYNEPPDMLIETIRSLEAIDYPNMEILIVDNNTSDEETWRPVEEYCAGRPRVRFFHAENVEGFKAGALNLSLREFTDPDAEFVGIVDADYLVRPDYLQATMGYFIDPRMAFVQTPQDYREYEGDAYLTACYDAYHYFFATSMPSRSERNSIIFAGTMGLIRRSALESLEGWDEWCITEDAEASLRLLRAGYRGQYVPQAFGQGIMPLTFSSLKTQRFRWCFGGIQILRKHYRSLLPWRRDPDNHLTIGQRLDYLFGGVQWFTDLLYLGFSLVLTISGLLLVTTGHIALRPLLGAAVLLPTTLIASGTLRALWALRKTTGISRKRAVLAFLNWLSMSWTVAWACLQGMFRAEGVFLRTPKWAGRHGLREALRATRTESLIAVLLWSLGAVVALSGHGSPFFVALFAWQGGVYAASPFMAWLAQRTQLSAQLERRQRSEDRRDRRNIMVPVASVTGGLVLTGLAVAAVVTFGGVHGGQPSLQPLQVPRRANGAAGPLGTVANKLQVVVATSPSPSPSPEVSPSPSLRASLRPVTSASPSPVFTAAPSPVASPVSSPVSSPTPASSLASSPAAVATAPAAIVTP